MHKALSHISGDASYYRDKIQKKNIIFLDIDGVIGPLKNHYREDHDEIATVDYLVKRYGDEIYKTIATFFVTTAYYDWDESAIGFLKKLLYTTHSYIVIHSDWRDLFNLEQIRALFDLYDMSDYILDCCDKGPKNRAIKKYLDLNKDMINNYVVLDDSKHLGEFGENFVKVEDFLGKEEFEVALKILNS